MSLQDFEIPVLLVEVLYPNSLVSIENNSPEIALPGNNKKHIVLLVNETDAQYINAKDLNFLTGILTACKLTLDDILLVNIKTNIIKYQALQEQYQPRIIIGFGINLAELQFPLEFPLYQVQHYNNQSYLSAPSLSTLAEDKNEKARLWGCLKNLFSL